uniref:Predicted protein n=1 Tax=Hordeum vulgare subsp. vulgare TaxID=112509 RepID=F2DBJ1_HORVV|nr:predicted protein [Hordeum vulgare subsp. vulgare]
MLTVHSHLAACVAAASRCLRRHGICISLPMSSSSRGIAASPLTASMLPLP